jgi:hypothetical protein
MGLIKHYSFVVQVSPAIVRFAIALLPPSPPPPSSHGSTMPFFVYTLLLCINRWPGEISRRTRSLTAQLVELGGGDDHAS